MAKIYYNNVTKDTKIFSGDISETVTDRHLVTIFDR